MPIIDRKVEREQLNKIIAEAKLDIGSQFYKDN